MARSIFVEDKIAYIFDSTSNVANTVSLQLKTQLNSTLTSSKIAFEDFLLNGQFGESSRRFFQNEFVIENLLAFSRQDGGRMVLAGSLEKSEGLTQGLLQRMTGQMDAYFQQTRALNRLFKVPFKNDLVLIFERFEDQKTQREVIFVMALRLSEIAEVFRSAGAQKIFLMSSAGEVWFGPEGFSGTNFGSFLQPSFLKESRQNIAQGAETLYSSAGLEMLVSFSRVGFGDLYVVSAVEKDKAMGAVQILMQRSLVFFVFLVSIASIIALFASSNLTFALTRLYEATQKIASGDFNIRVNVDSKDEVGVLADNFNVMAEEVSRLLDQTAEKARMESELNTARTVQETLFPPAKGQVGPLSVSGFYEPASECGGDWWYYCLIGDKVFLWIGDATGHGVPAALITAAARSASTIIQSMNVTPQEALSLLNKSIYDVSKGQIMMTFFVASFDTKTFEFTYANASHESPFLIKQASEPLKKSLLIPLNEITNPRLGQSRETVYQEVKLQLEPNDTIFFYTDGIPDIKSPDGETWGERNFIKTLVSSFKDYPQPEVGVQRFVDQFSEYRKNSALVDDVTFFVVKNEASV